MFSVIGSYLALRYDIVNSYSLAWGMLAEVLSILQTVLQTLFIMSTWWKRCKGKTQTREKPGRQYVTFLLVANMCLWIINTLIKGRASFRPEHMHVFGIWAWTIITHVSMPLAIFYRFHSTICLFEIWKTAFKVKVPVNHTQSSSNHQHSSAQTRMI